MSTQPGGKEASTAVVRRQAGSTVLDLYGELDSLGDEALAVAFHAAGGLHAWV